MYPKVYRGNKITYTIFLRQAFNGKITVKFHLRRTFKGNEDLLKFVMQLGGDKQIFHTSICII